MAQFYADENFPLPVVQFLRRLGQSAVFRRCCPSGCGCDPDSWGQAQRIDEAVANFTSLAGRLIRVNRPTPKCS